MERSESNIWRIRAIGRINSEGLLSRTSLAVSLAAGNTTLLTLGKLVGRGCRRLLTMQIVKFVADLALCIPTCSNCHWWPAIWFYQLEWLFVCSAICTLTQTFKLLWDRGRFSPISSSFQYFLPSFFCHDGEDFLLKGLPVQSIRINWYPFFIHHLNSTSVLLSPPSTPDNFMVLGFVICSRFFFFGYTCPGSSEPRYKLGIVIGKLVTYLVLILQPNFINGIAVMILFLPGCSTRIHVSYAQASSMIALQEREGT